MWVAHAPGMPGTFSTPPTSKETASQRSRHASWHLRDRYLIRSPWENVPGSPQPTILRIWQEAHGSFLYPNLALTQPVDAIPPDGARSSTCTFWLHIKYSFEYQWHYTRDPTLCCSISRVNGLYLLEAPHMMSWWPVELCGHLVDIPDLLPPVSRGQHWRHAVHISLQWRHNGRDDVLNHQRLDCLLNCFKHRSKKTSKLRGIGLCEGNSLGTVEFPAQKASNAENVSIWWRYRVTT